MQTEQFEPVFLVPEGPAQITEYGGSSLGNVPQRSVRNTNVRGTMPRSRSQSKQGRKSVPPPPTGTNEIGSPA